MTYPPSRRVAPLAVTDCWLISYPAPSAPQGSGQVQVTHISSDDGSTIVIVENADDGVTVTNAAEDLRTHLDALIAGPLHVIERWPAGSGVDMGEHYDRVVVLAGRPDCQRLHPTPLSNPRHDEYEDFRRRLAAVLSAAGLE